MEKQLFIGFDVAEGLTEQSSFPVSSDVGGKDRPRSLFVPGELRARCVWQPARSVCFFTKLSLVVTLARFLFAALVRVRAAGHQTGSPAWRPDATNGCVALCRASADVPGGPGQHNGLTELGWRARLRQRWQRRQSVLPHVQGPLPSSGQTSLPSSDRWRHRIV